MKKYNIISSSILLLFSGALYLYASTFPAYQKNIAVLNPGFYPKLLACIMALLAGLLLVTSILTKIKEKKTFWAGTTKKSMVLLLLTLVMLVIYPLGLHYVGFPLMTFFFILTLVYSLSERKKYGMKKIFLVSIGITLAIYLVFIVFLRIPFPRGIFFS